MELDDYQQSGKLACSRVKAMEDTVILSPLHSSSICIPTAGPVRHPQELALSSLQKLMLRKRAWAEWGLRLQAGHLGDRYYGMLCLVDLGSLMKLREETQHFGRDL